MHVYLFTNPEYLKDMTDAEKKPERINGKFSFEDSFVNQICRAVNLTKSLSDLCLR